MVLFWIYLHTRVKTKLLSRNYQEFYVWKCEFCEKWDFENVNFVKNESLKMWILSKMIISKCEFFDKLRIFALVWHCRIWRKIRPIFWLNPTVCNGPNPTFTVCFLFSFVSFFSPNECAKLRIHNDYYAKRNSSNSGTFRIPFQFWKEVSKFPMS